MSYRCFKEGCEFEAMYSRKCLTSEIFCCEFHQEAYVKNPNHTYSFDSIFVEPYEGTKEVIIGFLVKKKTKREKLKNAILASREQNLDNSIKNTEEMLRNLNSDIEEISGWIVKISQTQKISKKDRGPLLNLLALQPDTAVERLRSMIPASSDKNNSIRRLYWLYWLKAKTSEILNRFNSSQIEKDFRKTCSLYEKQITVSDPLLEQTYQDYIQAYHKIKSIYWVDYKNNLLIYDTESEKEGKKSLETLVNCKYYQGTARLPNGEVFFIVGTSSPKSLCFIIDRNYGIRRLPSLPYNYGAPIYFRRSVYCWGGKYIKNIDNIGLYRFDFDENRWIKLCFIEMSEYSIENSIEFNGNILMPTMNKLLLLYSTDIDSISAISFDDSDKIIRVEIIKAKDRLYLIECEGEGIIFESEVRDEYSWKKLEITIYWNRMWYDYFMYCEYNKKCIYISVMSNNIRLYQKFGIDQKAIIESSIYTKYAALKSVDRNLEAIKCYNQAYELDPDYIAFFNKGCELSELGLKIAAIEECNEEIKNWPCFNAYFNKANTLIELGKYLEAIVSYNEAIKFYPNRENPHYWIKDYDGQDDYEIWVNDYWSCYTSKANALKKLRRFSEAKECLSELNFHNNLFCINNQNVLAIDYYDEAIQCTPEDPLLFIKRAKEHNNLEQEEEALEYLKRAYSIMKENIQKNFISDYAEEIFYEDSNIINDETRTVGIDLLKKIIKLQKLAIKFKEEFQNLKENIVNPKLIKLIYLQKKEISAKHSQLYTKVFDFFDSDNQPIERVQQKFYKFVKEVDENQKWVMKKIADIKLFLQPRDLYEGSNLKQEE